MTPYTDGDFVCGTYLNGSPPRLEDAPDGARVKLRFRQDEIGKAFIRHANGNFSAWSLKCVDAKNRIMRLHHPIAQNFYQ